MNEDLYYEPDYDDFNCEPYSLEEALGSIGWTLDEAEYNPLAEF